MRNFSNKHRGIEMKRLPRFIAAKKVPQMWRTIGRCGFFKFYLRRGIEAALWRRAGRRVHELHAIFDTGSSQHFHVGDGKDALTIGA